MHDLIYDLEPLGLGLFPLAGAQAQFQIESLRGETGVEQGNQEEHQ